MPRQVRYGDYVQAVTVDQEAISYEKMMPPEPRKDKDGNEIAAKPEKLQMTNLDVYNLLKPYLGTRFMDQVNAVVPLAAYLALFQILVLQVPVAEAGMLSIGLVSPSSSEINKVIGVTIWHGLMLILIKMDLN